MPLQNWLPQVLSAVSPAGCTTWGTGTVDFAPGATSAGIEITTHRRCRGGAQGDRLTTPRVVKVIVSATLTRDPSKVGRLQLHSPLLLTTDTDDQRCGHSGVVDGRLAGAERSLFPFSSPSAFQVSPACATATLARRCIRGGKAARAACAPAASGRLAHHRVYGLGALYTAGRVSQDV